MTILIRVLLVAALLSIGITGAQVAGADNNTQNNGAATSAVRPRARDIGVRIAIFDPGALNAITDVDGVRVGHTTITRGDDIRTGVTAILPHSGNLFREKVPDAVVVFNAFGKLAGSTQVNELGGIETPVVLTSKIEALPVERLVNILKTHGAIAR